MPPADPRHLAQIASELVLPPASVKTTAELFATGATVPFIARYRKEATGNLDEVQIAAIRDRLEALVALDARRGAILQSLSERDLLTDELKVAIEGATTLTALEDLYLPYRPKRRTRATIAKEKGLTPLADLLWAQDPTTDPAGEAAAYAGRDYTTDDGKGGTIEDGAEALAGARDILAERMSDDAGARGELRALYAEKGVISSRTLSSLKDSPEAAKFRDYFEWTEPLAKAPSHRLLAMRRGEKEGFLFLRLEIPAETAHAVLERRFVLNGSPAAKEVRTAAHDAWKRLLSPSLETDLRMESKERADAEAIRVFAENLRELLLASPLGRKTVLAIDPGFRTGCKVVLLDPQGKLLHHDVVYPDQGQRRTDEAREKLTALVAQFKVEAIAIGNGTAGRETEAFVRALGLPPSVAVVMVNESGASIYSASDVAREEFPDHDLTVRGAVSIGRRLMDPLAELVKIDPKSIGVGQYQHDVDQGDLRKSLDDTVISCVNKVGVELNTASKQLLAYVSGLGPALAENIVKHRDTHGAFRSREELKNVPRLGPKAFEQCAGFLRISDGENPLDASAVHPERYGVVTKIAHDLGCDVGALVRDEHRVKGIALERYIDDSAGLGLPTLEDICAELAKPGRDPRAAFEAFAFAEGVNKPEDLHLGQKLPGIVTNVTAFGAFVDIGVHQDGLVHVSQLADKFVSDPGSIVKPGQKVQVTVVEVDLERKRIGLSMRSNPELGPRQRRGEQGAPKGNGRRDRNRPPREGNKTDRAPLKPEALQDDWFSAALEKKKR
ncbi:MAG: Tex family protein [Verrucomicrobiota bacterium]